MKLKNKKTGEMGVINYFDNQSIVIYPIDENWNAKGDKKYVYHSLTELNAEWEDYEEPKEWWYIDIHGPHKVTNNDEYYQQVKVASKEIGNYFESKEEAEKAVEKLKAFKRLKDKGFKFSEWEEGTKNYKVIITGILPKGLLDDEQDNDDLDLLFGGEEW